ncbi:MAG TPA: hypothetical protein PLR88_08435 [Bacteroidales bacterium]|nr:hypothetical protein [Bacteroidales bacterium]
MSCLFMNILMRDFVKLSSFFLILFTLASQNLFSQNEDVLFRKYVISSGWNGLLYGGAIDAIAELDGAAAGGVPIITSGVCVLIPLISNTSKTITANQLMLSGHGRTIGWVHGAAFSSLVLGENAWEDEGNDYYKMTIGLSALSSIGLGMLGNSLGKNNDWTEGQVALYRHYGWIMPFTGFSVAAAFSDDIRVFGGSILLFGAGGYLLGNKVNNMHEYTRGDIRATRVLTVLNGGLGYGILTDLQSDNEINDATWLIPAAGVLSGTLISHLWLKDADLSPQQGLTTAYASTGGAIIGLGIAMIVDSENATPWYLIPYATGLGAYAYAVEHFKRKNIAFNFIPANRKKSNWDLAFMPQNLLLNSKMQSRGYLVNGRLTGMQPVFSASVTF